MQLALGFSEKRETKSLLPALENLVCDTCRGKCAVVLGAHGRVILFKEESFYVEKKKIYIYPIIIQALFKFVLWLSL